MRSYRYYICFYKIKIANTHGKMLIKACIKSFYFPKYLLVILWGHYLATFVLPHWAIPQQQRHPEKIHQWWKMHELLEYSVPSHQVLMLTEMQSKRVTDSHNIKYSCYTLFYYEEFNFNPLLMWKKITLTSNNLVKSYNEFDTSCKC